MARWVVMVLLGAVAWVHLSAALRTTALLRFDALTHALMSLSMLVTTWPWGMSLPAWPQVVFFACQGAWFTAQVAIVVLVDVVPLRAAWIPAAHAAGMFAMVWMLVAMSRHGTGPAAPAVSLSAEVLGLGMLVVAVCWAKKAWPSWRSNRPWRTAGETTSHAVVHVVMSAMILPLR